MEKRIFNIATMPGRVKALEDAIASILPQADIVHVYLNEFSGNVPEFLKGNPKIFYYESEKHFGNIGDVGKFYQSANWKGYVFTIDDRFIYPADYAEKLIQAVEEYGRKAVISYHGRMMYTERPHTSYYKDIKEFLGVLQTVPYDRFAHELGTGVMCFHTDTYQPKLSMFQWSNMTDIYVSADLNAKGIPRVVRAHKEGYVRGSVKFDYRQSISQTSQNNCQAQTDLVNSIPWTVASCDRKISDSEILKDPYATHLPALKDLLSKYQVKKVVEFGPGNYSTPLFLEQCEKLICIEMQSIQWATDVGSRFQQNIDDESLVMMISLGAEITAGVKAAVERLSPDLGFVDGHLDSRPECVNYLMSIGTGIIVAHDYECQVYGWNRIQKNPQYQAVEYPLGNVKTLALIRKDLVKK